MLALGFGFWEEWSNPQNITFDPENKLIWINSGVTSIDVQIDLYSNWKEWVLMYDHAKYAAAFYTFGGDPTSQSQTAPAYFFLINGWKVMASNVSVVVQTNLYSDDGLSPFIVDNAAVTSRTSDVPIVRSEVEKRIDYGDRVYVDLSTIYAGTTYPNGTVAQPVNNLTDGITIANLYNMTKIYLRSNVTINDSYNLIGFDIYGDKNNVTVTSVVTTQVLEDTRFYDLIITGNFAGSDTSLINCTINDTINDINGDIDRCEISGTILVDNNIVISNSYSSRAGTSPGLVIDMNPTKVTSASVRAYSGGVKILNCNQVGDVSTIELIAGKITLDSGCTNGLLDLRGVGYLVNNASSGCTVITTGLVDSFGQYSELIQYSSFNESVYIDVLNGITGTIYPAGTPLSPVNNLTDAKTIAFSRGFKKLHILSELTVNDGEDVSNFTIESDNWITLIFSGTVICENTIFDKVSFYGKISGIWNVFVDCWVYDATNFSGWLRGGSFGSIVLAPGLGQEFGGQSFFDNCTPLYPDVHSVLVLNSFNIVSMTSLNGDYEISGSTTGCTVDVELAAGSLTIDSSCTGGYFVVRGIGYLINNAGSGCTVNTDGLVSNTTTILTDIYGEMTIVTGLTQQMSQDVTTMTSGFTDITTSIDAMTVQVTALDNKVSFISGTTYEMNQNVLIMTSGFTEINSGFTEMSVAISGMTDSVNSLDDKVSFISGTTYEMNQNVLTMTSQVSGITDDISTMTDAINVMGNEINDMFIAVNNLDAQIKRILGLSQENFRIVDQVYGSDNTLLSATIKIYSSGIDCDADINPLETYSMVALYDTSGKLVNYKVRLN